MLVNDSITAVLLFASSPSCVWVPARDRQWISLHRTHRHSVGADFSGHLQADGLLGAGLQNTSWLFTLWHGGFAMFVIAYALLRYPIRPSGCGGVRGWAIL